jgi:cell wall-associated NlpC family hydrolase
MDPEPMNARSGAATTHHDVWHGYVPIMRQKLRHKLLYLCLILAGLTPGFDSSGLVTHVYEKAWGLLLPRNAHAQSASGRIRTSASTLATDYSSTRRGRHLGQLAPACFDDNDSH